jgi:hypothetical protein
MVPEREQRSDIVVGDQPHVAAFATVAAVRAAQGDVGLTPERNCARAAVTRLHMDLALVNKHLWPPRDGLYSW